MSVFVPGYVTASGKTVRAYTRKKKTLRKTTSRSRKARKPLTEKQVRFLKAREGANLAAARKAARNRKKP